MIVWYGKITNVYGKVLPMVALNFAGKTPISFHIMDKKENV